MSAPDLPRSGQRDPRPTHPVASGARAESPLAPAAYRSELRELRRSGDGWPLPMGRGPHPTRLDVDPEGTREDIEMTRTIDITARRGPAAVTLRELGPDEHDVLDAVFAGLSATSRHHRFHAPIRRLTGPMRAHLGAVDGHRHIAVAAFAAARRADRHRPADRLRVRAAGPGGAGRRGRRRLAAARRRLAAGPRGARPRPGGRPPRGGGRGARRERRHADAAVRGAARA